MSEPFIAEVRMWGCNYAPRGWAQCDGTLLPISQNTTLFSLIGTIYGGDGRTTMGLPNLKGSAPMHWGNGPGLTPRTEGQILGSDTVTLTQSNVPSHDHIISGASSAGDSSTPAADKYMSKDIGSGGTENINYLNNASPTLDSTMSGSTLGVAGSSQAHENRQPYEVLNFCIATDGIYPSRS